MKKITFLSIVLLIAVLSISTIYAQGFQMIEVPGATLELGATPEQQPYSYPKEYPAHKVQMSNFMIGAFEVTQAQWLSVMGDNPSLNNLGDMSMPVDYIDWMSAIVFCNQATINDSGFGITECVYYKDAAFTQPFVLTDYLGDGNTEKADVFIDFSKAGYRLPTEAEWEFAARGGLSDQVTVYSGNDDIEIVAIYTKNSSWRTFPVGSKNPNELGIYDMSGNVWELVSDWYGPYPSILTVDPKGSDTGTHRVVRGGAYDYAERMCRVASRYMALPDDKDSDIGFRLARNK